MKQLLDYIMEIAPVQPSVLAELLVGAQSRVLAKGAYFIREGERAHEIGFLSKGIMRAFFIDPEGKAYTKQFFVGPSIIGAYTALIQGGPAKIGQQALTECEVLAIRYERVEALYAQYHELERLGRKIAERYFMEKEEKELEMALLDAEQRYLLMRDRFPGLEAQVPQYHVASYLGISPTQLSRIRRKLKQA